MSENLKFWGWVNWLAGEYPKSVITQDEQDKINQAKRDASTANELTGIPSEAYRTVEKIQKAVQARMAKHQQELRRRVGR